MRILLSDGSGLTSRQVATQLAANGHEVHVVSPDPLCLARFTRHVRRVHAVPPYGRDPFGWLDATLAVLHADFDALIPTQEQVAVLARDAERVRALGVAIAVPPFAALRAVQDKLAARRTLIELGAPQPDATVVHSPGEVLQTVRLPVYIKTPIGTASGGVILVTDHEELQQAARELEADDAFADGGVLVQQPVPGPLAMVQAVFDAGRLVAVHANLRVRSGPNGGASAKRSLPLRAIQDHLTHLGHALRWHGALSLDAVLTTDGPRYIDVNPRLVEPGNAWHAGTDLVDALLRASLGHVPRPITQSQAGVRTHQLLLSVLGAGQHIGRRRAVLTELAAATSRRGPYRDSNEELTPLQGDPLAALPVIAATATLLAAPRLWRKFADGAVANYALTPQAWRSICA